MVDAGDWRQSRAAQSQEPWLTTWLHQFQSADGQPRPLTRPYEFFGRRLEDPKELVRALDALLALKEPRLYPALHSALLGPDFSRFNGFFLILSFVHQVC